MQHFKIFELFNKNGRYLKVSKEIFTVNIIEHLITPLNELLKYVNEWFRAGQREE